MVQEPAEAEEYRSVSVDIGGIQRLLDLSTTALRDKGIVRARYSLERTSALYLLALCMLKSQDRETAIPHFLEAALPLLASSQMEQDVLSQRYRQQDRASIVQRIFCMAGEPEAEDEALPDGSGAAPEPMPSPPGPGDARGQALETASSSPRHAGKIRQLRQRLSSQRSAKLLRRHVSLLAERYALSLPAIRVGPQPSRRESARNASFRLPAFTKKLHPEKTVNATVQKAGYFTPVWRTKLETNEYLFLVRQLSRTDFEYQRIRSQILDLRDYAIFLNMYSYYEDPRVLWDALSDEYADPLRLEQLHQRHPDARLVLVTEGDELLNRLTFMPLSVAGELTLWARRALITPVPSADWGDIEGVIHYDLGFSIASSRENAFSNLDQLFGAKGVGPAALHSSDLRAAVTPEFVATPSLRYVEDAEPPREEQEELIFELKLYLEASGFLWLATCAFFPVTTPAVARFFAHKLNIADSEGTIFARLCILPWMRFGHMPRWVRKRLEQTLTESERRQARRAAASLLGEVNLVEKEGSEFFPGEVLASGGESLALPMCIDLQSGGEAELDELGIELLTAGAREEIDPVLKLSLELHAKLLKTLPSNSARSDWPRRPNGPDLSLRRKRASKSIRGIGLDTPDRGKALPADTAIDFREEYFSLLASNASIVSYLRQQAGNTTHFKIISINASYVVELDATTLVSRSYTVSSSINKAIPFNMWIAADDESDPIHGFRPLNIRIIDKKTNQNLGMLATEDGFRRKRFGIILSDLEHEEQKEFEVQYRWPGYMKRILEKGATEFYWTYSTTSPDRRGSVTYDWLFLKGFPEVALTLDGDHGNASLKQQKLPDGQRWTYHDPAAIMDGRKFIVSVKRV